MKRLLIALCLASLLLPSLAAAGVLGKPIRSIRVLGVAKVETEAILDNIALKEGQLLRKETVKQAIRDIWRLRYFDDVRVEAEDFGEEVQVVITVVEKPAIRDVVLEGNKKVTSEDIKEVMDVKAFQILDEAKIQATSRKILELYLEKGFFLAEVDIEQRDRSSNEVTIAYVIRENRKVLVKEINLVGNTALKDGYLKQRLQTKSAGILPGIGQAGTYRREVLDTDTEIIAYLYSAHGYVDADVSRPEVFLSPDKRWVHATIHVDEGEQYRVGDVRVQGDLDALLKLSEDEILDLIKTKPGEVYNRVQVAEDVQKVVDAYGEHGYAFANVIPLPRQDRERQVIDLSFDVQRGNLVNLEDVVITGNLATWDKVIRREVTLIEGQVFRGKAINETRARLQRLGYFEDVAITTPRGSAPDSLDLAIDVTEKPTGTFSLGAGFSTVESFVFNANISRQNFLGLGYTMALSANLSLGRNVVQRGLFQGENSQQQISFQLVDPYLLDTRITAAISVFSVNRTFQLTEFSRGFNLSLGHYLGKRDTAQVSLRYSLETVGLTSLQPYQKQLYGGQLYRSGTKSSLTASVIWDERNNRLAATRGWYVTTSMEWAGGFRANENKKVSILGGDFQFLRSQFNLRGYLPLGPPDSADSPWVVVLRGNLSLGWVWSLDGEIVPFTERYRAGGINTLRGFLPLSQGPVVRHSVNQDPVHAARDVAIGGNYSLISNVEIEFPIIPPAQVRGVVFFDVGNAYGGVYGDELPGQDLLRVSAGFGVRWRSPMGPLRFEWGFPLDRRPGERGQVFEFTIGSFF